MDDLCGVILAGGAGQRIQPLSFAYPKPMLPVCNRPIAEHQVAHMVELGIRDIFFVVGQMRRQITAYFGDGSQWGTRIHYVEQPAPRGIAHALSMLEPHVRGPMLVFLGDIFFAPKNLGDAFDLFRRHKSAGVLVVRDEPNPEMIRRNFSVEMRDDGSVCRVVEKPAHPPNRMKGCGLYLFDPAIFDAIRLTPPSALRNEREVTDAIQTLIDAGLPVYASEAVDWDFNITFPRDLLRCNLMELDRMGVNHIVGRNAVIPEGTVLRRAVVGNGVVLPRPMVIEDSVIFDGITLDPRPSLCQSILLRVELEIACREEQTEVIVLR